MRLCLLCRRTATADEIDIQTVRYNDGRGYQAIDRCRDRAACRARVEATGATWPVDDPQLEEER